MIKAILYGVLACFLITLLHAGLLHASEPGINEKEECAKRLDKCSPRLAVEQMQAIFNDNPYMWYYDQGQDFSNCKEQDPNMCLHRRFPNAESLRKL